MQWKVEFTTADTEDDRGCNELVKTITEQQAQAVIPPRTNRKEQREYDRHLYRERHLVECFAFADSSLMAHSLSARSDLFAVFVHRRIVLVNAASKSVFPFVRDESCGALLERYG